MNSGQNIFKNSLKVPEKTGTGATLTTGKPTGKPLTGALSLDSGLPEQVEVRENHKMHMRSTLVSLAGGKTERV